MDNIIDIIDSVISDETERLWNDTPIPDGLVHRDTGQPPTNEEWQEIKARAKEIIDNRYAAPELLAWAMEICPTGIIVPFERPKWMKS